MISSPFITSVALVNWRDTAVGNNKAYTIPSDTAHQMLWGYLIITSNAVAGARITELSVTDAAGAVQFKSWKAYTGQNSNATLDYAIAQTAVAGELLIPPQFALLAGWVLRIRDINNTSALDTLSVNIFLTKLQVRV